MSRQEFSVSYHGEKRADDHTMDVQVLAPALLAFGKLLREANTELNRKKSTTKVLVVSDFEHKCFNINFELLVSLYEQIKSLVGTEQAKNAKDILEWVGLLSGPPSAVYLSFLGYLRWKNGRRTEAKTVSDVDGSGSVQVTIPGQPQSVQITNHIYNLSQNPAALRATRDALAPIGQDGFDMMNVAIEDAKVPLIIDKDDADRIISSCNQGIEEAKELEPEIVISTAWLSVYSPVYDISANKWRFKLGTDVIYADISATSIAQDAIGRGGAMMQDAYMVKLEITTPRDVQGNHREPEYKVLEVLKFVAATPAESQGSFL
jgi:hypothetical protein